MTDKPTDLLADDRKSSLALATAADPWIDLSRAGTESEILMQHLTDRFAEVNEAYLAAIGSDPGAASEALRLLSRQLARAQADLFVLKSAVLGRDRLVLTRDWDYADPLAAHMQAIASDGVQTMWQKVGHYRLPLNDSLMGFGWYPPESNAHVTWRWSGPGVNATLLIPRFFSGRIAVVIDFSTLRPGVVPPTGGLSVGGAAVGYQVTYRDDAATSGQISFTLDLAAAPAASGGDGSGAFLPVEFALVRTYSPAQELGKTDRRELGICLRAVTISVA